MSDSKPNLDSLFLAASEIESIAQRDAFLANACGNNLDLRQQIEQLLQSDQQAGSFLQKPAPGLEATIAPDTAGEDRSASLSAGLATAFSVNDAVVLGDANHSVLKMLGNTLDEVPRVSLREPQAEGDDPIAKPNSPEVPQSDSDSRYRLDGEIARGGMGAIIKGRDTDLGRDLAIKVLLDSHKDKPEVIQRFVEEAQIGGQLQHPGIAPIYELGQFADKRPFFAMKLVKGQTLSKLMADREDASDERGKLIGVFEQICQTMAYAHSRGVIHRDLKPANIMVGAFGEVQVMDWGLAKVLQVGGVADEKKSQKLQQGQSIIQTLRSGVGSGGVGSDAAGTFGSVGSDTQMGSVMGTPAYMPPEQALGEIDMLDQRADVFGLGAILAEILTGKPPYVADDGTQIYRMASRGKLGDCFERLDECGADEELILLAKQCLEVEPADRPKDASALAEKVTGYLESVETKLRESEVELAGEAARFVEQKKRFRVTLGLSAAALTILLAGIAATAWQASEANKQTLVAQAAKKEATDEADIARKAEERALHAKDAAEVARVAEAKIARQRRRELYAANMQLADQLYNGQNGEQQRIEQLLAAWIPVDDQEEDLREFSWRYQWHRLHKSANLTVQSPCKGVAFTPENKMVVTDFNGLHQVDKNGSKRELINWSLNDYWSYFSPDGRWAAINVESGIELYHIKSRKKVLSLKQNRCAFSSNGEYLAAFRSGANVDSLAPDEDAIPVWKLEQDGTATSIAPLIIGDLAKLPVGGSSLTLSNDGTSFLLRNIPDPFQVGAFLNGNPKPIKWALTDGAWACAWSPDGKVIASAGGMGIVELRLKADVSQKLTIRTHGR
ncbi:MAG: WD40 repeat domain-containing serine/threonine protein kinase, partial [Rubripirellula sp.]